jgi:hypothetical protein
MTVKLLISGLMIAAALPLAAQAPPAPKPAKPDSFSLRVFRGATKAEELKFARDITREDSLAIRRAAIDYVTADSVASIDRFRVSWDTVWISVGSPGHDNGREVRVERRDGRWVAVGATSLLVR